MFDTFSEKSYREEIEALFVRFPSVQNVPFSQAYKPGLGRMLAFDGILGHPSARFRTVHVAGTNGKGSVSSMLAAAIAAHGHRTGLYTSPHLEDFRERMKIISGEGPAQMVPKEYVHEFIRRYGGTFDELSLSFFEISTGMAMKWFADSGTEFAVIETGLGGRLDSTNIVSPEISVITSIGLDHCDLLGNTLPEVAAEKAGIIKPSAPVVIGEDHPETRPVFTDKASACGSEAIFAEHASNALVPVIPSILESMDLRGVYQEKNLRTASAVLAVLGMDDSVSAGALCGTASRTGLRGRWEKLRDRPLVICDIGHNAHALAWNFRQLEEMLGSGGRTSLSMVYAIMSDKDLDAILPLMPKRARWYFATPSNRRAMPADEIMRRFRRYQDGNGLSTEDMKAYPDVESAVRDAVSEAEDKGIVYIGGSSFAVSEAIPLFGREGGIP